MEQNQEGRALRLHVLVCTHIIVECIPVRTASRNLLLSSNGRMGRGTAIVWQPPNGPDSWCAGGWERLASHSLDRLLSQDRCTHRFAMLRDAWESCGVLAGCTGVSMDDGFDCGSSGARKRRVKSKKLVYELRGGVPQYGNFGTGSPRFKSWVCWERARAALTLRQNLTRQANGCGMAAVTRAQHDDRPTVVAVGDSAARFGVLTLAEGAKPAWMLELVQENRARYCTRHGYTNLWFVDSDVLSDASVYPRGSPSGSPSGSGRLSTDRRAAALYLKVALFARELEKVDWLLWLDFDVFILDLLRPLERFTGPLEARGGLYHVRLPGESFTRRVARYQFSNYAYLVRNSPVGRAFAAAHLRSVTAIVQGCENSHLADQKVCPTR